MRCRSMANTLETRYHSRLVYFLSFVDDVTALWASVFYKGYGAMFGGDFEGRGNEVFARHNERIRELVEPSRLLEYQVADGWKPLCEFLQVPVPDEEFPRGNDLADFHSSCSALDRSRVAAVLRSWASGKRCHK